MNSTRNSTIPTWSAILDTSPIGALRVTASGQGLRRIEFGTGNSFVPSFKPVPEATYRLLTTALGQLEAYLNGALRIFDLPIDWSAVTPFSQRVLQTVAAIPYGEVRTYAQVAQAVGSPKGVRAVGGANAHNPLPLLIPCHRVIGSDGHMHGYAAPGGLETKAWLLRLEGHRFEGLALPIKD